MVREVLEDQRGEVAIFSKREQILLVQCVEDALQDRANRAKSDLIGGSTDKWQLTSEYSSTMSELTSRGLPLSAERSRYMVKL